MRTGHFHASQGPLNNPGGYSVQCALPVQLSTVAYLALITTSIQTLKRVIMMFQGVHVASVQLLPLNPFPHQLVESPCVQVFLEHRNRFHLYALYNKNKPKSDALMADVGAAFFSPRQLLLQDKLDLASYLLKPVSTLSAPFPTSQASGTSCSENQKLLTYNLLIFPSSLHLYLLPHVKHQNVE